MFIELHDATSNDRLLVNANDISTIVELGPDAGKTMLVFSGDLDTWRYVRESYEEIKMMLTDRLVADLKKSEVKDLLDKMIDRLEKCL